MPGVKSMVALRNEIDDLVNESFRKRGGGALSTDEMLKEVKRLLTTQIVAAHSDLIDVALKRLIDGVGRRKAGRRKMGGERDLFGDYPNIPQTLSIGEKKRKPTAEMSIGEAVRYLDSHGPKAVNERFEAMKRLVDDCLPFKTSDDDTIEELIQRKKRAAEAGSEKAVFSWSASPHSNIIERELVSAK